MRSRLASLAVAGAAAMVLAGCGGSSMHMSGGSQTPGTSETATMSGGVAHLTVDAGTDDRFQQTHLHAPPGKVEITLVVAGSTPHDLVFSDGPKGGTSEVHDGSTSVTLNFPQPGTYHFLCTIHPRMKGTLTIAP